MGIKRKKDRFAPAYHLYVDRGWLNDPCGCSEYGGEYHVFFQYHENPSPEGPGKWYHMKSEDLIRWQEYGICLSPEMPWEAGGCWTGSALEFEGKHLLFYSTNLDGRIPQQQPGLAVSEDGIMYRKWDENPVIVGKTPDGHTEMRDPKVFRRGNLFYLLQGSARDGKAEIVGYSSQDGRNWTYRGIFFRSEKWTGDMYECPDFFSIGRTDFLLVSPMHWEGHKNVLLCGKADFRSFSFHCDKIVDLDLGSDFYAAQSIALKGGRIGIIGWLGNWGKPHPEEKMGWAGMLSCLRVLHFDEGSGEVSFCPAEELRQLWARESWKHSLRAGEKVERIRKSLHEDIEVSNIRTLSDPGKRAVLYLAVEGENDTAVRLRLDFENDLVEVDKTLAQEGDNSCRLIRTGLGEVEEIRILIDGSALELFPGNGAVISERIYPGTERNRIVFRSEGGVECDLEGKEMQSLYSWQEEEMCAARDDS